ncbi:MAG: Cna B-type domain-containing protein [Clostridia bacterium]|nr:Cna B-type domain-containing protein [Clostridia bacterium]
MNFNKTAKRVFAMLIITVLCFTLFSFGTAAVSLERNGSITLHVADSEKKTPMEGARFRLYLFAAAYEKNNGVGYDYVVPYDDCNMDMNNLQDAYLAVHLSHFALTHNLPYTEKTSDSKGNTVFGNLKPGVYLILATEIVDGYFLPSPFIINIPLYNHENKDWEYNVNATPKMQLCGSSLIGETTYLSVKKLWSTDEKTPEKITVSLLRNLQEVERVELSEKNNWYYRWDNLEKQHTWNVVESIAPDGYKVSYDFSANAIIITNTKVDYNNDQTTKPDDTTSPTENPTKPTETTKPDDTTSPTEYPTKPTETTKPVSPPESTTKPEELIDTGQLNWPVPVFSIVGMLLFAAGWLLFNSGKKDEEPV